ncbi:MAG TPA: copper resistance protein B [Burkholderiales bacterium]|nr:copper resistance protein B [Burkholderiales bacterium]
MNSICLLAAAVCFGPALSAHAQAQTEDMKSMKMPATQSAQPQGDMKGMHMPSQAKGEPSPAPPTELQHLHAGYMIGTRPAPGGLAESSHGLPSMQGMDMSGMEGGSAPPDARSPDYSEGYRYGPLHGMRMADNDAFGALKLDELEYVNAKRGSNGAFIEGEGWYGKDLNKLWVKAEGESEDGAVQDLRTEALWNRALTPFWSTQLGVRHDSGRGPDRNWAAFGVEGLAPYRFETEATLYVGQDSRSAARLDFEYEALFTQRLILQPKLEVNLYGKDDPRRGIGSGLSDAEFGLRLRYEVKREIAPYIGLIYRQRYGGTADLARLDGMPVHDRRVVAGLRIWFF